MIQFAHLNPETTLLKLNAYYNRGPWGIQFDLDSQEILSDMFWSLICELGPVPDSDVSALSLLFSDQIMRAMCKWTSQKSQIRSHIRHLLILAWTQIKTMYFGSSRDSNPLRTILFQFSHFLKSTKQEVALAVSQWPKPSSTSSFFSFLFISPQLLHLFVFKKASLRSISQPLLAYPQILHETSLISPPRNRSFLRLLFVWVGSDCHRFHSFVCSGPLPQMPLGDID